MQKIVLNNREEASRLGMLSNWEFVHDKVMSPDGIDITPISTIEWRSKPVEEICKGIMPVEVSVLKDGKVLVYTMKTKDVKKFIESIKTNK